MKPINKARFKYIWEQRSHLLPYIDKIIIVNITMAMSSIFALILPLFSKVLLDYAYPNQNMLLYHVAIFGGLLVVIIQALMFHLSNFISQYLDKRIPRTFQRLVFNKILHAPLSFHNKKSLGDRNTILTDDSNVIHMIYCSILPSIFQTALSLVFALYVVTRIDSILIGVVVILLPIAIILTRVFANYEKILREQMRTQRNKLYNHIHENLYHIKTVKSFTNENSSKDTYADLLEEQTTLERKIYFAMSLANVFRAAPVKLLTAFVAYYAGYKVVKGTLSIGDIAVLTMYVMRLYGPCMGLVSIYSSCIPLVVSIDRLRELESVMPESKNGDIFVDTIKGQIQFDNVWFRYQDNYILKGVSFTIKPNTIVALCGKSGIGKTTLIDLIPRFYSVNKGTIFLDGKKIEEYDLISLRKNIAIVPQEYVVFQERSIRDNILYGNIVADDEEFSRAVKIACVEEIAMKFADKYDTVIGGESGIQLSAGERQRIAIARAIITGAKLLLLDEISASLDTQTEVSITTSLRDFCRNRTAIIIAHRMSTIRSADHIIMLDDSGTIAENGSFDTLMSKKGLFATYYNMKEYEKNDE